MTTDERGFKNECESDWEQRVFVGWVALVRKEGEVMVVVVGVAVVVSEINIINVSNLMLRKNSHKSTDL